MNNLLYIGNSALFIVLKLISVPIALATVVGVIVGLFQTVMQIQEQTLPFGLKMLAVFASIFMMIEWFSTELVNFTLQSFSFAFK